MRVRLGSTARRTVFRGARVALTALTVSLGAIHLPVYQFLGDLAQEAPQDRVPQMLLPKEMDFVDMEAHTGDAHPSDAQRDDDNALRDERFAQALTPSEETPDLPDEGPSEGDSPVNGPDDPRLAPSATPEDETQDASVEETRRPAKASKGGGDDGREIPGAAEFLCEWSGDGKSAKRRYRYRYRYGKRCIRTWERQRSCRYRTVR